MAVKRRWAAGLLLLVWMATPATSQTPAPPGNDPSFNAVMAQADALHAQKQFPQEHDYLTSLPTPSNNEEAIRLGVRRSELMARYVKTDYALANQTIQDLIAKYSGDFDLYFAKWEGPQISVESRQIA